NHDSHLPLRVPMNVCILARQHVRDQSKDIDLWQVIQYGDFVSKMEDPKTKMMKETPYELLEDDKKKKFGNNNEAKITLYNALSRNSQVKDYKIGLLTRQYDKFSISSEEVSSCTPIEMESQGYDHLRRQGFGYTSC
ncbi:hypothetical protein Tco_0034952, partial [Tanacetum coccineum]